MVRLIDIIDKPISGEWGTDDNEGIGIPVLRTTNFTDIGEIDFKNTVTRLITKKNLATKYLQHGDIIIEKSGGSDKKPVGRVVYFDAQDNTYLFNNFTAVLRVKHPEIWNPRYVFYALFASYWNGRTRSYENRTTGLHNLQLDSYISSIVISDKSIEEQNIIVDQLDNASCLIYECQSALSDLNFLIKARFVEMFGAPGTDIKGWGLKPLGECCELNPKKGSDKRLIPGLNVSFVPMPAVSENGAIDASDIRTYDDVKTGFTYFAENDVLFAKITPCMENGKGGVAKNLCNGIGFGSTEFHVMRPLENISTSHWLYTLSVFNQFRKDAAANMTGSAGQRRVPVSFLDRYMVALPPIELQNQFAGFIEQVNKSIFEIQNQMEDLNLLKQSLLHEYFTR